MSSASAKRNKRIVVLRIPSSVLSRYPNATLLSGSAATKSTSPEDGGQNTKHKSPTLDIAADSPVPDAGSESNATPAAGVAFEVDGTPEPNGNLKRRGIPGPKPGQKRSQTSDPNARQRARGKPGPKRRKLMGEPNMDSKSAWTAPTSTNHKLGPKANQGAINAGLRALDRTGKQCRRWHRKGFQLKSFTGVEWSMPSWRTPQPRALAMDEDGKNETTESSDAKRENASSAVGSETNNIKQSDPVGLVPSSDIASSPAPNQVLETAVSA